MKNTFGNQLTLTLFGESHGEMIGAVLDGLAPGLEINDEYIKNKLALRRPFGSISTGRVESDDFEIASGVFNGYTTGAPICILIFSAVRSPIATLYFLRTYLIIASSNLSPAIFVD